MGNLLGLAVLRLFGTVMVLGILGLRLILDRMLHPFTHPPLEELIIAVTNGNISILISMSILIPISIPNLI